MKKPGLKIKLSTALKYLYLLIFILVLSVSSMTIWFLYKNFYQTVAQTQTIILLRQEVAPDTVNIKQVNDLLNYLDKKNDNYNIVADEITNIFSSRETTPQANQEPEEVSDIEDLE